MRKIRGAVCSMVVVLLLLSPLASSHAYNPPEGDTSFHAHYDLSWKITDGHYNAHGTIVLQAIEVLAGDLKEEEASFFRQYAEQLLSGAREADEGGGTFDMIVEDVPRHAYSHFWNPETNAGFRMADAVVGPLIDTVGGLIPMWKISSVLGPNASAADMTDWLYAKAVEAMRRADDWDRLSNQEKADESRKRAMRFLGYALHLVADSTVPQHADDIGAQDLVGNHVGYENLCDDLIPLIHHATSGGIYNESWRPADFYYSGARTSHDYSALARLPISLTLAKEIIKHRTTLEGAIEQLKAQGVDLSFLYEKAQELILQSDQEEDHFFPASLIRLAERLSAGLLDRFYNNWAEENFRVVTLDLYHVQALPGEKWMSWPVNEWVRWTANDVDYPDWADFYVNITIGEREFRRGVIQEGDDIWPNTASAYNWVYPCWLSGSTSTIPVVISLWDDDGVTDDDHVDISPQGGRDLDLTYDTTNGRISGDVEGRAHSTASIASISRGEISVPRQRTTVTVEGDDRDTRARIQFDLETVPESAPRVPWQEENQWEGSWLKFFGGPDSDFVTSVIPLADGGFILAGFIQVPHYHEFSLKEPGYDLALLKMDSEGSIVWQKRVAGIKDWGSSLPKRGSYGIWDTWGPIRAGYYWVDLQQTSDQGFVLVYDSFLLKLNSEAEVEWSRQFYRWVSDEGGFILTSVVELPEGGFVICGNHPEDSLSTDSVFLARLDEKGELIWAREYDGFLSAKHPVVELTSDGFLLVGSRAQIKEEKGEGFRSAILKIDASAGVVVWGRSIEGTHIPVTDYPPGFFFLHEIYQTCTLNSEGEIFLAHASVENVGTGSIIAKLNPQGELLWATRIHSPRHGGYTLLQALVPVGGGVYAIGETTEFGHQGYFHYHSFVARLDEKGSVLWIRTLGKPGKTASGMPGEELGLAGALLSDEGILLLGTTDAFSTAYDVLAARLGPNGAVNAGGDWLIAPDVSNEKQVQITTPQVTFDSFAPPSSSVKILVKDASFETAAGTWEEISP